MEIHKHGNKEKLSIIKVVKLYSLYEYNRLPP